MGLVAVAVGHGWAWPHLRQWHAQRQEPGYVKIVGGFKSNRRRVIRYADGTQDVTAYAEGAFVSVAALGATASVTKLPWWRRIGGLR